jgi:phytanoyl-CoA hydroxylase
MRERFVEQGYLWVKGLIPREEILDFRRKYFEFMAPTGVLKEGTDPIEGIYCGADPEQYLPPGNGREGHNTEKAEQVQSQFYRPTRI